jgi:hypothetical protein
MNCGVSVRDCHYITVIITIITYLCNNACVKIGVVQIFLLCCGPQKPCLTEAIFCMKNQLTE